MSFAAQAQIGVGERYKKRRQAQELDYANPKEYTLSGVRIVGAQTLDEDVLLSITGLKIKQKISIPSTDISLAIQRLWKQGFLNDVSIKVDRIEEEQIFLAIYIEERPRLLGFSFKGLRKTRRQEIEDDLSLVKGKIVTDVTLKNVENGVRKYLEKKGYLQAKVRVEQEADTLLTNGTRLLIKVKKGRKVRIKYIHFENTGPFAQGQLKWKMKKTGELPRMHLVRALPYELWHILRQPLRSIRQHWYRTQTPSSWKPLRNWLHERTQLNVFKSSKYKQKDFDTDKEGLVAYMRSKGYRNAHIASDTLVIRGRYAYLKLKLDIGRKYYFRHLTWSGNYVHSDSLLNRLLNIKKGDVYDMSLLQKKLNYDPQGTDINSLYTNDGYLFFRIEPTELAVVADSIDVEMRLFEGPQTDLKRVYLTGNERVYDHVLLRELYSLPGQKFSRSDLVRSQQALGRLGFVDAENTTPLPLPDAETEEVDIEWQIAEKVGDQIELSAGWGGGLGLIGTVGFTLSNFSLKNVHKLSEWRPLPTGDGQQLSIRLRSTGLAFFNLSTSFTEPWLGGRRPNSLTVGYSLSRENSLNRSNQVTGSFTIHNAQAGLNRALRWPDDFFSVGLSLNYKLYLLDNISTRSLAFTNGTSNNFSSRLAISRNSVNHPIYPTGGSLLSLSTEVTPPYSLWREVNEERSDAFRYRFIEYHKWMGDLKFYTEFFAKLVLESRAHAGYIGKYRQEAPDTPFERFSVGGDGLTGQSFILGTDVIGLRGYPNNGVYAEELERGLEGGRIFVKYVMELRYPILQSPSATLYILSFVEAGNNWNKLHNALPFKVLRSSGGGVRALLPAVGFLGIDWGYRLDGYPGRFEKNRSEVHFILGQPIR